MMLICLFLGCTFCSMSSLTLTSVVFYNINLMTQNTLYNFIGKHHGWLIGGTGSKGLCIMDFKEWLDICKDSLTNLTKVWATWAHYIATSLTMPLQSGTVTPIAVGRHLLTHFVGVCFSSIWVTKFATWREIVSCCILFPCKGSLFCKFVIFGFV